MSFTDIDGLRVHYHAGGDLSASGGRRVLYVHGTGCNGRLWGRHMAAIADRHSPVAIDLPGHGQSEGRGFRGVADYAHIVVQLAAHLGWDRFVVAGHSLGGAIALTVAVYHAEFLEGLMLIDTGARLRVDPVILDHARLLAAGAAPAAVDPRQGFARGTPQSVVDAVRAMTADTDPRVTYKDWIADDSFDVLSRVGAIDLPAIAICGAEDPLTPVKYHEYFRDRMPACVLEVIPQAGHWPYVEQPDAFDRIVRRFLDGLPP